MWKCFNYIVEGLCPLLTGDFKQRNKTRGGVFGNSINEFESNEKMHVSIV
jgi:hypothetical protein